MPEIEHRRKKPVTLADLRAEILKAATYHADEGTSGYLLAESQVDAIMGAAERYADGYAEHLLLEVRESVRTQRALHDLAEQQLKLATARLARVRELAGQWAYQSAAACPASISQPPGPLAACGVAILDIVAPERSRVGEPEGAQS
jgi:hypothetical protein